MVGSESNIGSSDIANVREFIKGVQAERAQAHRDMATSVALGVVSAVVFSKIGQRSQPEPEWEPEYLPTPVRPPNQSRLEQAQRVHQAPEIETEVKTRSNATYLAFGVVGLVCTVVVAIQLLLLVVGRLT